MQVSKEGNLWTENGRCSDRPSFLRKCPKDSNRIRRNSAFPSSLGAVHAVCGRLGGASGRGEADYRKNWSGHGRPVIVYGCGCLVMVGWRNSFWLTSKFARYRQQVNPATPAGQAAKREIEEDGYLPQSVFQLLDVEARQGGDLQRPRGFRGLERFYRQLSAL